MKKKVVLLTTLSSTVLFTAFAFAGVRNFNYSVNGIDENHDHTVIFDKSNYSLDREEYGMYYFNLSKTNAIVVSETEKYDLGTTPGESFVYAAQSDISFTNPEYLFVISGEGGYVGVYFSVLERADVDLAKSCITFYDETTESSYAEKFDYDSTSAGKDTYYCYADTYSRRNHNVGVLNVKIVFSC